MLGLSCKPTATLPRAKRVRLILRAEGDNPSGSLEPFGQSMTSKPHGGSRGIGVLRPNPQDVKQGSIMSSVRDRDNPFDLVPNLAESPHTLPFLSLEAYHRFLTLAGDSKSAAKVKKHMSSM